MSSSLRGIIIIIVIVIIIVITAAGFFDKSAESARFGSSVCVMDSRSPHSSPQAHLPHSDAFFHPSAIHPSSVHAFIGSESSMYPFIHHPHIQGIPHLPPTVSVTCRPHLLSRLQPPHLPSCIRPCLFVYSHFRCSSVILPDWSFHSLSCPPSLLFSKREIILPNLTIVLLLICLSPHAPES